MSYANLQSISSSSHGSMSHLVGRIVRLIYHLSLAVAVVLGQIEEDALQSADSDTVWSTEVWIWPKSQVKSLCKLSEMIIELIEGSYVNDCV